MAIIVIGHMILIAAYFIIKDKVAYNERDKLVEFYKRMLQVLEPDSEFEKKQPNSITKGQFFTCE